MQTVRIILADDHILLRSGLKMLLESRPGLKVVGEASDGLEALHIMEATPADIIVLDLSMPNMDGMECIREIKSRGLAIRAIVLSMHEDENYVREVMQAGAMGFVQKGAVDTELFEAINCVRQGKRFLSPNHLQCLLTSLLTDSHGQEPADDPYVVLSTREREVLKLLARGHSISDAAAMLTLSVKTVDTYKTRMMEKLGFSKRTELVSYALKHGLLANEAERRVR
ncbi:two-component system response regulator [Anaerosporomusa subterranea]|uniref:Two-component system response regulator n=1 Tax=Anaerosporomusa subterranea TaxID=1794912 RepID=A0A154BPT6_ANASB|nr:response regulator transcription factor [Anaerosporomusa subterranea]KYZ75956.1 two-component system response regulator [Anaerosporomusa subterranea]